MSRVRVPSPAFRKKQIFILAKEGNEMASTTQKSAMTAPWESLPEIDLRQLIQLTDDTGIFQHAVYATPDPNHGYCIDDNARALIAALLYARLRGHDERVVPMQRYLAFLAYAWNDKTRAFRNFMGYDRHWLEDVGSQDSQGRTLWSLGMAIRFAPDDTVRELARDLIEKGLPAIEDMAFIRSWAFALIGLNEFLFHEPKHDYARRLRDDYARRLFDAYQLHATDDWPWWEDTVTYDNAKLCQALMECGRAMNRPDMFDAGMISLRWLLEKQTAPDGHLTIIGNNGMADTQRNTGSVRSTATRSLCDGARLLNGRAINRRFELG